MSYKNPYRKESSSWYGKQEKGFVWCFNRLPEGDC